MEMDNDLDGVFNTTVYSSYSNVMLGNKTGREHNGGMYGYRYALRPEGTVQLSICIIGLIVNVISIVATLHIPQERWHTYHKLIINLAISDIVTLLSVIVHDVLEMTSPGDHCTDTARRVLLNVSLTSTLFNLVLMAVDHYLAIMYALYYDRLLSATRVSLAIGCIWCASVLCSVLEIPSNLIGYEL